MGKNSLKLVRVDLFEETAPFSFEVKTNTCHLGTEEELLTQTSFKRLLLLSTFQVIQVFQIFKPFPLATHSNI